MLQLMSLSHSDSFETSVVFEDTQDNLGADEVIENLESEVHTTAIMPPKPLKSATR